MKIIVGLGNPGEKYAATRHNVGFFFADKLQNNFSFPAYDSNKKFQAEVSKGKIGNTEVLFLKPQTFMNLSGTATRAALDFYKLSPDDLLVIHDDLDIALGKCKLATDSSSAGHNGVQNIIDQLGTQKFRRLRVGIGQEEEGAPVCRLGAHDFVLGKFGPEETEAMEKLFPNILQEIEKFIGTENKNTA